MYTRISKAVGRGLAMTGVLLACQAQASDLVEITSKRSPEHVEKAYTDFLKEKGVKIFSVIDHAQAAKEAGLELPFKKVIIFGNPKLGTGLMKETPTLALDLPMRTLIAQDGEGSSLIYRNFEVVLKEHGVSKPEVVKTISGLLDSAAQAATK